MVATFSDHCASFVCDTNVPAERVPEVSNVDVSTDPTTFSVDFPPDAGVEPIEVTVKREVVMRCSAGIFGPFLVGRSEQEARKFLAGAYAVVSLFLRTGPGPTEEESAALQAFFLHLPCSRPVLKTAVGPTLELISNTEIVLLGLLCLWLHRKNADSSSWIVVDLPPGVGKTFAVERLAAIVNKNREPTIATVITTPTMKTAQLYPRALKIGPEGRFVPEHARRTLNRGELFVFDEFSMYGRTFLLDILAELRRTRKCVLVIGDTCQMPPVQQKALSWFEERSPLSGLPFGAYVMAHADVRVPRIDAASPEFRMLILAVRQCILRCVLAKSASGEPEPPSKRQRVDQPDTKQPRPRAAPPLKFVLDARKIGMWISKLTMFNILPTLTAEDALFFLAAQQTRILDFVARLREHGFYGQASPDTRRRLVQDLLPADLQLSLPVFAGYENALNLDICASLQKRCSIAEACQSSNTIVDAAYGGEPSAAQNFRSANCVWLPRAFFQTRVLEEIAKTGNSLTAHDNLFLPGMTIRSRENVKSQDIHTNQTAIFLAFRVREPWRFQSLRRSEYVLTAAKVFKGASAKAPRRTAATESATQFELDSPAAFEMTPENMVAEAARLVEMLVLDVSSRSLKVVRPCIKFLCEGCEKGEACCSAHLAEASRVCYLCFNWTVYYTNTIFNLQGSTISDDRLFLLPQHVFRSNKLRTLYILLSRCARPQQIVTDVSFVRHVLAIVFNTNVPKIDEFLSANELSIKPNFSLDQLTRASA